jgi:hypothetical protein
VLAYDEATRTTAGYTITAVLVHTDLVIIDVIIDGEHITTTPSTPSSSCCAAGCPLGNCTSVIAYARQMAAMEWCRRLLLSSSHNLDTPIQ